MVGAALSARGAGHQCTGAVCLPVFPQQATNNVSARCPSVRHQPNGMQFDCRRYCEPKTNISHMSQNILMARTLYLGDRRQHTNTCAILTKSDSRIFVKMDRLEDQTADCSPNCHTGQKCRCSFQLQFNGVTVRQAPRYNIMNTILRSNTHCKGFASTYIELRHTFFGCDNGVRWITR